MPATEKPSIKRTLGEHKLATKTISIPPERIELSALQTKEYSGFEAIVEARELGLLRVKTRHAEASSTQKCPEDCGGCPDRKSLHLNDPPEVTIGDEDWLDLVDNLEGYGVEYLMLIGGTIDRQRVTPLLIKHVLEKETKMDVGWFTDGIMLQNPHTGNPTKLFENLSAEGRILEITTHVSADYLVEQERKASGPVLDPKIRWENEYGGSRYYKSAYGERLAIKLVQAQARRVVINTAVSSHNIQEVLPIYNFVSDLQEFANEIGSPTVVLHTMSPWVHRPHLARGDDSRNYDASTLLRAEHSAELVAISQLIYQDTVQRLENGLPRIAGNSSGFISGFPGFSVNQNVPYINGSGEFAVQPNGTVRIDPIFVSAQMLQYAKNPYGYRDRDIDYPPFATYDAENRITFPNLIQTTRGGETWK